MSDAASDSSASYDSQPVHDVEYPVGVETEVPGTSGGLHKTVLVEGTGTRPVKGSKVTVHYVGTLASDGSLFDSSRDRGEYFEFTIGRGQVIKGWDVGVASMRVGEKSVLRCAPDYAYGAAGSPPKIPANSTLLFEVELFDWTKEEDVSAEKDRSILKSIAAEGVDYEKPGYESTVTIDIRVHRGGREEEGELVGERAAWSFVVGDEPLPPALELCLATMRKKESAAFRIAAVAVTEAFAPLGVVPGAEHTYDVELHALTTVKTWEFTGQAKVDEGVRRKDEGNAAFREGNLERAERKYRRALEFVESDYGMQKDEEKASCRAARITVWGNLSQVLLQRKQLAEARAVCDKVIAEEPDNCKALFRRAKAADGLREWDAARRDLERLLEIDAGNADAAQMLRQVREAQKEFDKKQRALYKNMFSA